MKIIDDGEKQARVDEVLRQDKRENPLKYALLDLDRMKDGLIDSLVASARRRFIQKGEHKASADIKTESSVYLVEQEEAERRIAGWLEEYDPSIEVTSVRIGPDCSGNYLYAAEVVVEYRDRS